MNQALETTVQPIQRTRKTRCRSPVTVIVEREFVGDKTVTEALLPIIFEDLRRKMETLCAVEISRAVESTRATETIGTFDTPLDST